jgi:molecular chaperone HscC
MSIIGIDLGTTNSLVAALGPGGPACLANEFDEHLIPSAVAVAVDGALLTGRAAKDRLVGAPDSGRAFFKRDMGTPATYRFGGRAWTPTECSAAVLRELRRIAALRLGEEPASAVITVPAYFHDSQRQATVEAAHLAGLEVARILNEPTAAALAFGHRHRGEDRRLLVFDLGGGTFDVTVLEVFAGIIEVKASGGDGRLGGEDWTDALVGLVAGRLGGLDPDRRGRLRQVVEVAKRRLAADLRATIALGDASAEVTRADFDQATAALVARLRPVIRRCLRDAGLAAKELDDVLMVGGASRMPAVQALVLDELGRPGNRQLVADRVVALGAAVQAGLCAGDAAVDDVVLTDVCPHTLGVEVAKEFAPGQQATGFFAPIIERNTTVPVSRSDSFHATHPDQDQIELKIYQGEGRMVRDNTQLGTITVRGVKPRDGKREPGEVEVRFTYDMNGILEVDVTVQHSGKRHSLVIEQRPGQLSREQVAEALRRLAPLKAHPRDLLPNRARIERAERLFGELSGAARAALSARLDDFEAALASQEPHRIQESAAVLDSFLRGFYQEEGEAPADRDPQGA